MNPQAAAVIGFLFSLPFVLTNFIVALRIEPFYSFLGWFPVIRNSPLLPLLLLLLFPIGAFIALRPLFQKRVKGKRKYYLLNIVVSVLLLAVFLILFLALGEELYRCNILHIPNCD